MGLWCRVFGRLDTVPPTELLAASRIDADDTGWYRAEIMLGTTPMLVERWLADEAGVRSELNSWAGFLETCDWSPHHVPLMERAIQTRQLFTIRKPIDCADEAQADRLFASLGQSLAQFTQGFFQIDDVGFFESDGTLLIEEY